MLQVQIEHTKPFSDGHAHKSAGEKGPEAPQVGFVRGRVLETARADWLLVRAAWKTGQALGC
jgi:hypothetical protein